MLFFECSTVGGFPAAACALLAPSFTLIRRGWLVHPLLVLVLFRFASSVKLPRSCCHVASCTLLISGKKQTISKYFNFCTWTCSTLFSDGLCSFCLLYSILNFGLCSFCHFFFLKLLRLHVVLLQLLKSNNVGLDKTGSPRHASPCLAMDDIRLMMLCCYR